jgi:hypothetical protein
MKTIEIRILAAFLALLMLMLSGCATVSNPYVEPNLPNSQAALLSGQKTVVYLLLYCYGRRVNIAGVDHAQVPVPRFIMSPGQRIKLEPGVHTVKLRFWKKNGGSDTYSNSATPITFLAEAGHCYEARATQSPGKVHYTIFDKTTGQTVPLLARRQQNQSP